MTRQELTNRVWAVLGNSFSKSQVILLMDEVFAQVEKAVLENEPVKIRNFGTFLIYKTKPTIKNLPGCQHPRQIPRRHKLKFIPSRAIANKLLDLK